MVEPVVIGSAGVKFLKDASTQLITISNTGNSATPKEMYSSYLGTWQQFVVPINSKFIPLLIQINISESGGSGTGNVILSDGTPGTPSNTWWECNVTDNQSQENNPFCSFFFLGRQLCTCCMLIKVDIDEIFFHHFFNPLSASPTAVE